jgi:hypothetical protein
MRRISRVTLRRPWTWAVALGAIAVGCGGSSDLGGFETSSGGGGGPASSSGGVSGSVRTTGGVSPGVGGAPFSGGTPSSNCQLGTYCSTPNSYCTNSNYSCQCINGRWGNCFIVGVTGGAGPTGGSPSGGSPSGGRPTVTGGVRNSGGTASGGRPTGGNATGGAASAGGPPVCTSVTTLPPVGTSCSKAGEAECDAAGQRCVCAGSWYCNTACNPTLPPTPDTACSTGLACNYPGAGVACSCVNSRWVCLGGKTCPAAEPLTGDACNGLSGQVCDYPGSPHYGCACLAASTGAVWTCVQLNPCPALQPVYPTTCPGLALCSYGGTQCGCLQAGTPWTCV